MPITIFSVLLEQSKSDSAPKSGTGISLRSQAADKPDPQTSDMPQIQGSWETLLMQSGLHSLESRTHPFAYQLKRGVGGNSFVGEVREY